MHLGYHSTLLFYLFIFFSQVVPNRILYRISLTFVDSWLRIRIRVLLIQAKGQCLVWRFSLQP